MNLKNLILENFGKFEKFEFELADGINVVKGANETGKSTLVAAITAFFYGNTPDTDQTIKVARRWGSDQPLIIRGDFSGGEQSASLVRNFDDGSSKLDNPDLGLSVEDDARIFDIVSGSVGFSSASLFEATSCIKQGEITNISKSIEAIKDNLGSMVKEGQEELTATQVINNIENRQRAVISSSDAEPGLIKILEKDEQDIDYQIDLISREVANLKNWRANLAQVNVAYSNMIDDLKDKKEQLDSAMKAEQAAGSSKELRKRFEELDKKLELLKTAQGKANDVANELEKAVAIKNDDKAKVSELESSIKYLNPRLKDLEQEKEQFQGDFDNYKVSGGLFVWMIISILGLGTGIADYMMVLAPYGIFIGYGLYIAGGSVFSMMVSMLMVSRGKQKKSFLKDKLKTATKKYDDTKEKVDNSRQELDELLNKYHISSTDEIQQAIWKRNELKNQVESLQLKVNELLDGKTVEDYEVEKQEIEKKLFDAKITLENFKPMEPAELERMKLIVGQLEEQHDNLKEELKSLTRQIESAVGGAELLGSYLERKEAIRQEKDRLKEELAVLELTKEYVDKTRQKVMVSTLEVLEKRTSEILRMITNNKYSRVRFDKQSLKFEVFSDIKNDWVDPHLELSRETLEQLYLTARLALTELLAKENKPPIILDDPFSGFDSERRESTMKVIKQMSEGRQVVLLTTNDNYDQWADNLVTL